MTHSIKILIVLAAAAFTSSVHSQVKALNAIQKSEQKSNIKMATTIYDFTVEDISGNTFDLAALKGKKVMIVNTASKCGLTPQYEELEKLYQKYLKDNLVIIGFPANNFAEQEPGSNEEIATFCSKNYGVTFPMMAKISVNGADIHELYSFLNSSEAAVKEGFPEVQWNFQKFLIGTNGKVEKVIGPKESPMSDEVIKWIEQK